MLDREAMSLSEQEREKYEKAWALDKYRDYSPGEHLVERAIADLGMTSFETVIDFGCGTGRAAKKFQDLDFSVLGVDFVPDAVETDIAFKEACLWDLPVLKADWGFCTDVMEHIPTEKVSDVLDGIRRSTAKGAFFQIALTKDSFGDRIGERLHLTVKPTDWWIDQLSSHWGHVKALERGNNLIAICKPTN